jgi:hypothetical protein
MMRAHLSPRRLRSRHSSVRQVCTFREAASARAPSTAMRLPLRSRVRSEGRLRSAVEMASIPRDSGWPSGRIAGAFADASQMIVASTGVR